MTERNPILQSLFDRKSVRVYEEKPIPAEMKQAILEAAVQAPSAGCQQLYTILDITDPALKEALAESCDHQPFIAKAPLVLVFCADCKKWYDAYLEVGCTPRTPGVGDLMLRSRTPPLPPRTPLLPPKALASARATSGTLWRTATPSAACCTCRTMCSRR